LPVDAEAAWAFGLLSALLGLESEFALQRIKAAGAAVPRNGDLSMTQAMLHQRLEQPGEMREQLLHTVRHARTQRQILWARQRLELVPDTRQP
jgi:hypothetical protein